MAAILVKTGTWLYDGDHLGQVKVFKDNVWEPSLMPSDDYVEEPPPVDKDGFYYYARFAILSDFSGGTPSFGSLQDAMEGAAAKLPSPVKWADQSN
jgi:hypothetical protein